MSADRRLELLTSYRFRLNLMKHQNSLMRYFRRGGHTEDSFKINRHPYFRAEGFARDARQELLAGLAKD